MQVARDKGAATASGVSTMAKDGPTTGRNVTAAGSGPGDAPAAKTRSTDLRTGADGRTAIDAFLEETSRRAPANPAGTRGRLIFALDATMSRQPTWDLACRLQGEMFAEAARLGGLDVQLLYYRGFGECRASRWAADAKALAELMTGLDCRGGQTQIGKVLSHARRETGRQKVQAMVFVGDALEEGIDTLAARAGELGLLGMPVFFFQEGRDPGVERGFRELARLSGGAYARFDASAAGELAALLRAVAAYAAGGRAALTHQAGPARLLLEQMR